MDIYAEIRIADPFFRKALYLAFDGKCFYTGRQIDFEEMHTDHIKPAKFDGKSCIANLVATCHQVNSKKSGKYSEEFGNVVLEYNKLVYAPLVLSIYQEIAFVDSGFIQLNKFLEEQKINPQSQKGNKIRNRIKNGKYHRIDKKQEGKNRGIVLYMRSDLESILASI